MRLKKLGGAGGVAAPSICKRDAHIMDLEKICMWVVGGGQTPPSICKHDTRMLGLEGIGMVLVWSSSKVARLKTAGGGGGGGDGFFHLQQNARMICLEGFHIVLKQARVALFWFQDDGFGHLQTQCSHDGFGMEAQKLTTETAGPGNCRTRRPQDQRTTAPEDQPDLRKGK